MANTYSQIYLHIIFAVKYREALIQPSWESLLFQYITGIVRNKGQKMLAINGTSNHIHLFIGIKPDICASDLVREIKKSSSTFIKEQNLSRFPFRWQEGFGAFSYSDSQIDNVIKYIIGQKEHHKIVTFRDEYVKFLNESRVEYNLEYVFENVE